MLAPEAAALDLPLRLYTAGRLDEAARECGRLMAAFPRAPEIMRLMGAIRFAQGAWQDAELLLIAVLGLAPGNQRALNDLACLRLEQGRLEEALSLCDQALACDAGFGDAALNRGIALLRLERAQAAAESFGRAVALLPDQPRPLDLYGNVLVKLGRDAAAEAAFRAAIAAGPRYAKAHANLGALLQAQGRAEEAQLALRAALALEPGNSPAWNNLATSLLAGGDADGALEALGQALNLAPDDAMLNFNMGNALAKADRQAEAVGYFQQALAADPGLRECAYNLSGALVMSGRPLEALAALQHAEDLGRDAKVSFATGLALLSVGRLAEGFARYEARRLMPEITGDDPRHSIRPYWDGSTALAGKIILLHAEQGLGDTVQFCRYAPMLAELGARVLLEAPYPLLPLLETLDGISALIPSGTELPEFDLHCAIMSLPHLFGTTRFSVPARVPYLGTGADRVARWVPEMPDTGTTRVALAWSGNGSFGNDRQRSMPLQALVPLLAHDCAFYAVQTEVREQDREVLRKWPRIHDLGAAIVDFADTAAVLSLADLVITVDTSIAHVAGALGRPVWLMLPFVSDWRWMTRREDSLWYPTARLFRQTAPGDWAGVVARVSRALGKIG
jgi:tetratricopeptide (TPR) repeat protein